MIVVYWDASAILSLLVEDQHSRTAMQTIVTDGVHLLSSLAESEVLAVLQRMKAEKRLSIENHEAILSSFENEPFRYIKIQPERDRINALSGRHILKGADLWHLAATLTITGDLPETKIFTFDNQLIRAAKSENVLL
jgi:predicted nucleic acid-binding protein